MTTATVEDGTALDEGGHFVITPNVVGPTSPYPPELAEVHELHPDTVTTDTEEIPVVPDDASAPTPDFSKPVTVASAPQPQPVEIRYTTVPVTAPGSSVEPPPVPKPAPAPERTRHTGKVEAWASAKWNGVISSAASAAFVTGMLGSGLGQLSYWVTKFPFWLALSFALTFELAMVGISRRVRDRRSRELPAGAMHLVGWLAALGAAGWNLVHLSSPDVVVAFEFINDGKPLFHGGPVVGTSFATMAVLGFLIHELSESYTVEDVLAAKGKTISRIGVARLLNYPRVSLTVWRSRVADPAIDVDAEFLRVLSTKRGERVLRKTLEPAASEKLEQSTEQGPAAPSTSTPRGRPRSRSDGELNELIDAVKVADQENGARLGVRKLRIRFELTESDARTLRTKTNAAAQY